MKASEIDKKFDDNQDDILQYFDTSKVRMINEEPKVSNQLTIKGSIVLNNERILIKIY